MKSRLKRLGRRILPPALIARFRLHQQSRHARVNVDVFIDEPRLTRRWLGVAPDTYRVRKSLPAGSPPADLIEIEDSHNPLSEELRRKARTILNDPEISVAVVAETPPPRITGRYRSEPRVGPRLIIARPEHLDEVGGIPDGETPLPELLAHFRAAGHRIGLIPIPAGVAPTRPARKITRDTVVILAMVPMHDVGGGARSSQIALELLRQGFYVVLVNVFEADETVDLGIRFIHPNFEQIRFDDFDPISLHERVSRPGTVLVEAPHHQMKDTAFTLQDLGWEIVYDVIDDWSDHALGGGWFSVNDEKELTGRADRIIASAPDLVERVRLMRRPASLVPNAVNAEIFGVDRPPRPGDLPTGQVIIGYHGSLYGDWFDWYALREVAEAFPDAAVVVIGDDKVKPIELPDNVYFLGLKAQVDLPGYLQHFDVGLIPFKVSPTTHAVSPLKVFEYLASGVPVAAPPLRPLAGLDGVYTDYELVPMVEKALAGPRPDRAASLLAHSWTNRVNQIVPPESRSPETTPTAGAMVMIRPVRHWSKAQRRVG